MEQGEIYSFVKKNLLFLVLLACGIAFIFVGLIAMISQSQNKPELQFQSGQDQASSSASVSASQGKIVVDIEGAVINPGIYTLADGSRMHDLIVASGGLSASADRDWFAKNLNQAAKLADGQKVYIPREGEEILPPMSTGFVSSGDISALIGINSASLKDLDSLPGIGIVTAQKIVDNRPYSQISDLLDRKVVTASVFEKIKDKISTN